MMVSNNRRQDQRYVGTTSFLTFVPFSCHYCCGHERALSSDVNVFLEDPFKQQLLSFHVTIKCHSIIKRNCTNDLWRGYTQCTHTHTHTEESVDAAKFREDFE